MSGWKPLTCKEVERILKNLGFYYRNSEASHDNWVPLDPNAPFRKVTVDCPKAPFSQSLIGFMHKQAGVSKKEFYAALHK
jgi:predicted RNA binding protein YcfA (HicA-like mRNA interferase family)